MLKNYLRTCALLLILALSFGCATKQDNTLNPNAEISSSNLAEENGEFLDFDQEDLEELPPIADPLEPWNRFWFSFNDAMLLKVLKPIHQVYATVIPEALQDNFKNFKRNLAFPVRFVNSLLQGKFGQAGVEFGRFFINTTVGFGGLFDVAKKDKAKFAVDPYGADFGQTLAVWGFGEGFYLILPFMGPSTLRDTFGSGVDSILINPLSGVPLFDKDSFLNDTNADAYTNFGLLFNNAEAYYSPYEMITQGAIEKYTAVRSAWTKILRARLEQK